MRALLTRDGLHQFPGAGRDVGEQRGTESMRGLSCSLHEESWHALAIEHGAVIPSDGEFFTAVTISVNPRKTARSEARGAHHHVKVFCHHVSGYSVANVHVDAAVGTITRTEHLRGPANIEPLTPGDAFPILAVVELIEKLRFHAGVIGVAVADQQLVADRIGRVEEVINGLRVEHSIGEGAVIGGDEAVAVQAARDGIDMRAIVEVPDGLGCGLARADHQSSADIPPTVQQLLGAREQIDVVEDARGVQGAVLCPRRHLGFQPAGNHHVAAANGLRLLSSLPFGLTAS